MVNDETPTDREGPAAPVHDHHRRPCSTSRSTGTGFLDTVDRASRLVPRLRQRVLATLLDRPAPLGGRPQLRPRLPRPLRPGRRRRPLRDVLDLAEPIAMQGFDRARPLWEFDVVDGLEDGRSALIMKLHHAITDGVGGVKLAMHLFDLDREAPTGAPSPRRRPVHVLPNQSSGSSTPSATSAAARSASSGGRRHGRSAPPAPCSDPAGSARRLGETAGLRRPDARARHHGRCPTS